MAACARRSLRDRCRAMLLPAKAAYAETADARRCRPLQPAPARSSLSRATAGSAQTVAMARRLRLLQVHIVAAIGPCRSKDQQAHEDNSASHHRRRDGTAITPVTDGWPITPSPAVRKALTDHVQGTSVGSTLVTTDDTDRQRWSRPGTRCSGCGRRGRQTGGLRFSGKSELHLSAKQTDSLFSSQPRPGR